ncbi:MAG: hypothetical protein R2942_15695 [Ignavibacteria bacterium]
MATIGYDDSDRSDETWSGRACDSSEKIICFGFAVVIGQVKLFKEENYLKKVIANVIFIAGGALLIYE